MTQDPLSEDTSARHAGKEQEIRAWRPNQAKPGAKEVKPDPGDHTQAIKPKKSNTGDETKDLVDRKPSRQDQTDHSQTK